MRIVNKTISLERFRSRLPGVLPSYDDGTLYYFDKEFMLATHYLHYSNYGLFPINTLISGVTIETIDGLTYLKATSGWSACTMAQLDSNELPSDVVSLSYERISDIYAFFRSYYSLLNENSSCGLVYSSATEFYDSEAQQKFNPTLYFGSDRTTYTDMDIKFARYGGVVSFTLNSEGNIIKTVDVGLFEWICKNIVPTFNIPSEYVDVYKSHLLYFPDAYRWFGWLTRCGKLYDGLDSCSASTNCCECEEYLRRGGQTMRALISAWIEEVNALIEENKAKIAHNLEYNITYQSAFINDSLTLLNPVKDIGEMSPLAVDFESGVDYTPSTEHKLTDCISGGTVVVKDNMAYIIKNGQQGFKYDDRFCEIAFGNDTALVYNGSTYDKDEDTQWEDYVKDCIEYSGTSKLYVLDSSASTYTYNYNNHLVYNPTPVHKDIVQTYSIDTNNGLGYVWYNDSLLEVESLEYVQYSNNNPYLDGAYYEVLRDTATQTPYIIYNGRAMFAVMGDDCKFRFSINTTATFLKKEKEEKNIANFVRLNDQIYPVVDDSLTITSNEYTYVYPKLDGIFNYSDDNTYYISGDTIVDIDANVDTSAITITYGTVQNTDDWVKSVLATLKSEDLKETEKLYYEITDSVRIVKPYTVYLSNYITGTTTSQLNVFLPKTLDCDDVGNKLDGYYYYDSGDTTAIYAQPIEGTMLTPYYNVGNTANVYKLYEKDDTIYYIGDIITSMTFFYNNLNGAPNEGTYVSVDKNEGVLSAIDKINAIASGISFLDDTLYCQIKYLIGATLTQDTDNDCFVVNENAHLGVEYTEDVTFIESQEMYYLSNDNGYLVKYYAIGQNIQTLHSYLYDKDYSEPMADFKMRIITFNPELDGNIFTNENGFELYNNQTILPLFKQEYLMNCSGPSTVDGSIDVDRGIATAFEKHLKLGEVASFEALESYGNGFFSIVTD